MSTPKKPQGDREFTYHVGWKKGIIHKKTPTDATPSLAPEEDLNRFIWRSAPMLPASLDFYLLCALPVVSIVAIYTLIYLLHHL
jgi:hypothetical protein